MRDILDQMNNRTLFLNLAITQAVLFVCGILLYYIFLREHLPIRVIFHGERLGPVIWAGVGFAVLIIIIDIVLMKLLPHGYFDDGGVNERIFRDVNPIQIALIALTVAFVEEWLFRAVLQNLLGLVWASLIFALIHFRYFKKLYYALLVITISFGFGLLYEWSQSIWSVLTAHFLIDFCLGLMIRYKWLDQHSQSGNY